MKKNSNNSSVEVEIDFFSELRSPEGKEAQRKYGCFTAIKGSGSSFLLFHLFLALNYILKVPDGSRWLLELQAPSKGHTSNLSQPPWKSFPRTIPSNNFCFHSWVIPIIQGARKVTVGNITSSVIEKEGENGYWADNQQIYHSLY